MLRVLEQDRHLRGLSAEEKKRIVNEAIEFGSRVADLIRQEYGTPENYSEMKGLAEKAGAVVQLVQQGLRAGTLAEYDEKSKEIFCYAEEIEKMESSMTHSLAKISGAYDLLSLTIAHELFHHLENTQFVKADKLISREVVWFGLFRTRRAVSTSREIAAHAFVKKLLNLPEYPIFNENTSGEVG
jgi:hypothetical protein